MRREGQKRPSILVGTPGRLKQLLKEYCFVDVSVINQVVSVNVDTREADVQDILRIVNAQKVVSVNEQGQETMNFDAHFDLPDLNDFLDQNPENLSLPMKRQHGEQRDIMSVLDDLYNQRVAQIEEFERKQKQ
jgi:superfamily II DNA/RNA helicase